MGAFQSRATVDPDEESTRFSGGLQSPWHWPESDTWVDKVPEVRLICPLSKEVLGDVGVYFTYKTPPEVGSVAEVE